MAQGTKTLVKRFSSLFWGSGSHSSLHNFFVLCCFDGMLQNKETGRYQGSASPYLVSSAPCCTFGEEAAGCAVQSQHREGFQMLVTHSARQDLTQLCSPWDIFRQHRWLGAQRNHGTGSEEVHPTSSQAHPPHAPAQPRTARGCHAQGRNMRETFSCWAAVCHPISVTSCLLACCFVILGISGRSFHCSNNFLGLWDNLHVKAT